MFICLHRVLKRKQKYNVSQKSYSRYTIKMFANRLFNLKYIKFTTSKNITVKLLGQSQTCWSNIRSYNVSFNAKQKTIFISNHHYKKYMSIKCLLNHDKNTSMAYIRGLYDKFVDFAYSKNNR